VWSPPGDVFTLLWRALAWGSGSKLRQNTRRLVNIAADVPRAEKLLTTAAETSRHDPRGAYAVLRPGVRNAIPSLGPSFFTKFLYFAGQKRYRQAGTASPGPGRDQGPPGLLASGCPFPLFGRAVIPGR